MKEDLRRIRGIADYQFGRGAGMVLFPDDVSIDYSRNTGRIRHIYAGEELLAAFRPNDGLFTLTIAGAKRLISGLGDFDYTVVVDDDVSEFVGQGRNVFAKHVVDACEKIRPGDEVIVVDSGRNVLAVGKAVMIRKEMLAFKRGVAVKVRRGRETDR
jgi:predicted RNA-binding protein (TIGR00451 family)